MKNKKIIDDFFDKVLGFNDNIKIEELLLKNGENNENNIKEINKLIERRPSKEKIIKEIDFTLGGGTQILYE